MKRPARKPGGSSVKRGARTGGSKAAGKAGGAARGKQASSQKLHKDRAPAAPVTAPAAPLRLGFARGVAPSKWASRWAAAGETPLELLPLSLRGGWPGDLDVVLERVDADAAPLGTVDDLPDVPRTRHALRLYEEAVALVLPVDHELAEQATVSVGDLSLVTLFAHPDHLAAWPAPQPWDDPSWAPVDAEATMELVATGAGGALMPLPLARHLAGKRTHAVLPVEVEEGAEEGARLPGTWIWASWAIERDAPDVQHLVGVLRGRTARSSR